VLHALDLIGRVLDQRGSLGARLTGVAALQVAGKDVTFRRFTQDDL